MGGSRFSPLAINSQAFRAEGAYTLTPEDMETGNCFYDSVALGRAPLDVACSLLSSSRGKIALAQPFEIPLRTMYSKKIKNLLFAGEHASFTSRASASFSHPPTSAQMGEAVGACAALCVKKKRLPRTISKPGNVEELRRNLNRLNHTCSLSEVEDPDNLIVESKVVASTTTRKFLNASPSLNSPFCPLKRGLVQFPVTSKIIDEVMIFVEVAEDCKIELRLLENSSKICTIPGNCLNVFEVDLLKGGPRWERIPVNVKVKNVGWHYLEFDSGGKVTFFLQENAYTGTLLYKFANHQSGGYQTPTLNLFLACPSFLLFRLFLPLIYYPIRLFLRQRMFLTEELDQIFCPIYGSLRKPILNILNIWNFIGKSRSILALSRSFGMQRLSTYFLLVHRQSNRQFCPQLLKITNYIS